MKRFNLASTLADFEAKLDARFANFEAKLDAFFDAFDAKVADKNDACFDNFEAKVNTTFAKVDAELEAPHLLAWTGIAPSIHIPSSTMTWMSSLTAAGSKLRIEEVCARQDAPLEADFRSFADELDQRQPSTHASFALLDDDGDDDPDEAIHIVRLVDDADIEFEDTAVVLIPPPPLPYTGAVMPFGGGGMSAVVSHHAVGF